jgi:hypothetical protein
VVSQLATKSPLQCSKPGYSLPCSQDPVNCLCAKRDSSTPHRPAYILAFILSTFDLCLGLSSRFFPSVFHTTTDMHFTFPHTCTMSVLDMITLIFGYKQCNPSTCNCLRRPLTSSVLEPKIFRTLCSSHYVTDQVSHPRRTMGKITVVINPVANP